jgi:hypothetical protein
MANSLDHSSRKMRSQTRSNSRQSKKGGWFDSTQDNIIAYTYLKASLEAFKKYPTLTPEDITKNMNDMKKILGVFKNKSIDDGYENPKSLVESSKQIARNTLENIYMNTAKNTTTTNTTTTNTTATNTTPTNTVIPTVVPNVKPPNVTQPPNSVIPNVKPPNSVIPNVKPPNVTQPPNILASTNIPPPLNIKPNASALNPMAPPTYTPTPNTLGGRRRNNK